MKNNEFHYIFFEVWKYLTIGLPKHLVNKHSQVGTIYSFVCVCDKCVDNRLIVLFLIEYRTKKLSPKYIQCLSENTFEIFNSTLPQFLLAPADKVWALEDFCNSVHFIYQVLSICVTETSSSGLKTWHLTPVTCHAWVLFLKS